MVGEGNPKWRTVRRLRLLMVTALVVATGLCCILWLSATRKPTSRFVRNPDGSVAFRSWSDLVAESESHSRKMAEKLRASAIGIESIPKHADDSQDNAWEGCVRLWRYDTPASRQGSLYWGPWVQAEKVFLLQSRKTSETYGNYLTVLSLADGALALEEQFHFGLYRVFRGEQRLRLVGNRYKYLGVHLSSLELERRDEFTPGEPFYKDYDDPKSRYLVNCRMDEMWDPEKVHFQEWDGSRTSRHWSKTWPLGVRDWYIHQQSVILWSGYFVRSKEDSVTSQWPIDSYSAHSFDDGRELWHLTICWGPSRGSSEVALYGDTLVCTKHFELGDGKSYLYAIDATSGKALWRRCYEGKSVGFYGGRDDALVIRAGVSSLEKLDARTGAKTASLQLAGKCCAPIKHQDLKPAPANLDLPIVVPEKEWVGFNEFRIVISAYGKAADSR